MNTVLDQYAIRVEVLICQALGVPFVADPRLKSHSLAIVGLWVLCGLFYGAIMGCYGGFHGDRLYQVVYSAAKVPLLFLATFVLALPFLFVVASLWGLRHLFGPMVMALIRTQAGVSVILAVFGPFTVLWYLSVDGYAEAIFFNAIMFGLASLSGQLILRRHVGPLLSAEPRVARLVMLWIVLYAFVGIQMGWVLRPFIGQPDEPVRFLRASQFGNAYAALWHVIQVTLTWP